MSELVPQPDLMRALGRLVRGLSALFWGLPLALVVGVQTAKTHLLAALGIFPPVIANGLIFYGLWQLGYFQKHELTWRHALDRAKVLALVNLGLAPFLYWWKIMPHVLHYQVAVLLLALSGMVFLFNLNFVLQRLAALLPDETLRLETRLFTNLNLYLLVAVVLLLATWLAASHFQPQQVLLQHLAEIFNRLGLVVVLLLVLLPVALTMALIWKIKETILASVFSRP